MLNKYQLPTAEEIMEKPPTKHKWEQKQLKVAIDQHWSLIWTEECRTKSTLKYLSVQNNPINNPYIIWKYVKNNQYDIKKAEIKCKLVTGTYMLQITKANCCKKYISPCCRICKESDKSITHFILVFKVFDDVRQKYLKKLLDSLKNIEGGGTICASNQEFLMFVLLDCSAVSFLSKLSTENILDIERQTQDFCLYLHTKTCATLMRC